MQFLIKYFEGTQSLLKLPTICSRERYKLRLALVRFLEKHIFHNDIKRSSRQAYNYCKEVIKLGQLIDDLKYASLSLGDTVVFFLKNREGDRSKVSRLLETLVYMKCLAETFQNSMT